MRLSISGASETRKYLRRLITSIPKTVKDSLQSNEALGAMQSRARADVLAVVYAVYSPKVYQRTFELLQSVNAVALNVPAPGAGAAIVIDLTEGNRALGQPGDVSYARFFLPEFNARSYLNSPANQKAGVPSIRDFLTVWHSNFSELLPPRVSQAIDREMRR